jgi:hypothetical protein
MSSRASAGITGITGMISVPICVAKVDQSRGQESAYCYRAPGRNAPGHPGNPGAAKHSGSLRHRRVLHPHPRRPADTSTPCKPSHHSAPQPAVITFKVIPAGVPVRAQLRHSRQRCTVTWCDLGPGPRIQAGKLPEAHYHSSQKPIEQCTTAQVFGLMLQWAR